VQSLKSRHQLFLWPRSSRPVSTAGGLCIVLSVCQSVLLVSCQLLSDRYARRSSTMSLLRHTTNTQQPVLYRRVIKGRRLLQCAPVYCWISWWLQRVYRGRAGLCQKRRCHCEWHHLSLLYDSEFQTPYPGLTVTHVLRASCDLAEMSSTDLQTTTRMMYWRRASKFKTAKRSQAPSTIVGDA